MVNLSLLNTDWYMRQLRDERPRSTWVNFNREIDAAADFSSFMTAYRMHYIERSDIEEFLEKTKLKP
ncbi:MAG: hypothetical protein U0527_08270 [Candidatus Eisenbacteria bacterium]